MPNKFAHIKQAKIDPEVDHHCHWPGCKLQVPRAHLMCGGHWYTVPKPLRDRVLEHYVMGQELHPGMIVPEYFDAVNAVLRWAETFLAANATRANTPSR